MDRDKYGYGLPVPLPRGGMTYVTTLQAGERIIRHPSGVGFIITHPDHGPQWWRIEAGAVMCERIEIA